ncbi:MAG TPA: hypothetical protein VF257_15540 [Solirubrobacteraceae bacterium]
MTGAEWLERVFERALRVGDPAAYPEVLGALRALGACGVLSGETATDAERRLNERFEWPPPTPPDRSLPDVAPPGSRAAAAHDQLEAVLAPARPLADVDGLTIVLVSVELWTSGLLVRLAALRNALSDELDANYGASMMLWAETRQERGPEPEVPHVPVPLQPGDRLLRLPLTLFDDVGTRFSSRSRSAGGTGAEWHSEWRFEPGVPQTASRLTIALEGDDGHRYVQELALPETRC